MTQAKLNRSAHLTMTAAKLNGIVMSCKDAIATRAANGTLSVDLLAYYASRIASARMALRLMPDMGGEG